VKREYHIRRSRLRWLWLSLSVVLAASLGLAGLLIVTSDGTATTASPRAVVAAPAEGGKAAAVGENATDRRGTNWSRMTAPLFPPAPRLANVPQPFDALPAKDLYSHNGQPQAADIVPDFALPPVTNGLVPVLTRIPTQQKVVFLTIDDGANKTPEEVQLLKANGIKATLFLAQTFISNNPDFFKGITAGGSMVEDHTLNHLLNLTQLSYAEQKAEICGMADYEQKEYGRRPVFLRPPGGPYTTSMRKAAADCGLKAIIDWEAKSNAGHMDYQYGASLRPGEIVLMHFRPEFASDLSAFLAAQKAAGLQVVLLEDYLKTG